MNRFILTFETSHQAMEEEERLTNEGIAIRMIPTPRGISSECGFSIRIDTEMNADQLKELCPIREGLYRESGEKRKKSYERID